MKKITVFSLVLSTCFLITIGMLVLSAMDISSEKTVKAEQHFEQAAEFNRLAAIYLEGDDKWMDRIMQQRERIKETKHKGW